MTFKLHHPLWTHLPALACIAINLGLLLSAHLPARVPTHFHNGLPDRWGSPQEWWFPMIGIPLLIVIWSAVMDERHARHEQERRFNFASLIDEPLAGLMAAAGVKIIPQLSRPEPILSGMPQMTLLFVGGAVALAALLELLRPYRPGFQEEKVDVASLVQSIQPQFQPGGRWLYWEKQDQLWWRCLSVLMTALFVVIAGEFVKKSDYGGVAFFAFLAMLSASGYGGFHVTITPKHLTIRSGSVGLALLRLKLANVQSAEVMKFSALADGFGWGLYRYSFSLRAWGFILGGNRGVMIHMKSGRDFLISSNTPEKLAAATEAARIAAKK